MKKHILAIAVLAAASATHAAEIYSNDKTTVKLKGEVDAFLAAKKVDTSATAHTRTDPNITTWGKIQVDAITKMTETLDFVGSFEIEKKGYWDSDTYSNDPVFDDMYLAVKSENWGVAIGETGDLADSMDAVQKDDITNEGYMIALGSHRSESKGYGIAYQGKLTDDLTLVADANTESDTDIDNTYGLSLDYTHGIFSIGGSYVFGEADATTDYSVAGLSASLDTSGFFLGLTAGAFEGYKSFGFFETSSYYSGMAYGVATSYTMDNSFRVYATYAYRDLDEVTATGVDAKGDMYLAIAGVNYDLISNLTIFAEYQTSSTSKDFADQANLDAAAGVVGAYYTF